jgi:hypothetical protein
MFDAHLLRLSNGETSSAMIAAINCKIRKVMVEYPKVG